VSSKRNCLENTILFIDYIIIGRYQHPRGDPGCCGTYSENAVPVKIELKAKTQSVRRRQCPIKMEVRTDLELLINDFTQYGLLTECQSAYNTPILPVRKLQTQEYRI